MSFLTRDLILAPTDGHRRLVRFCHAVEAGETPSAEDMKALAAGFRGILDGEKPERALGLARPKGRPEKTANQLDEEFAKVQDVLFDMADRMAAGKTQEAARGETAAAFDVAEDTLKDWWRRHRMSVQLFRSIKKQNPWWDK